VVGESAGGALAWRGNEGQLLESLAGTGCGSGALFRSDRLNINGRTAEKRRAQGGFSDPEHRAAAGTLLAIEEGGAERGETPDRRASVAGRLRRNRWGYGGGQCRVHRILGPLANNPAEELAGRGWVAGHRGDVEFASLIHPS
jgi:hypothetical protein